MSDMRRRLITLRSMQAGACGYARIQYENGETTIQLNTRGLRVSGLRVYGQLRGGETCELGKARVSPRGDAILQTKLSLGCGGAAENLQAFLLLDDSAEPKPLMIGLCARQTPSSILNAKNALLALCDSISRTAREKRLISRTESAARPPRPEPANQEALPSHKQEHEASIRTAQSIADADSVTPPEYTITAENKFIKQKEKDRTPPEVYLPAMDPYPYIPAQEASSHSPETAFVMETKSNIEKTIYKRRTSSSSPVNRLHPVLWPTAFATLKPYFDNGMPSRLLDWPGWRFVQTAQNSLWIGCHRTGGRIRSIAYIFSDPCPPDNGCRYQAVQGLDGKTYQVLRQTLNAPGA